MTIRSSQSRSCSDVSAGSVHVRGGGAISENEFTMLAEHADDCARMTVNGGPVFECGGVYTCPRCECDFGWCLGCCDDTPALCDECANEIQFPE